MPWTKFEYPPEMKYLPVQVRKRAIAIANSLMKETRMQESSAVHAAIHMARDSSTQQETNDDKGLKKRGRRSKDNWREIFVIPYQGIWAIRVERSTNVQERFATKKLAVEQAKREAFLVGAAVTIFKKDGTFHRCIIYNRHTKSQESERSRSGGIRSIADPDFRR